MSSKQRAKEISRLASKVNVFDAFDAFVFGDKSPNGARFVELYAKYRELKGDTVRRDANGYVIE